VLLQWVDDDDVRDTTSPSSSTSDTVSTSSSSRKKLKRVDTFHSYVRPTWRPELGDFCTNLTGITQVGRGQRKVTRAAAGDLFVSFAADESRLWLIPHRLFRRCCSSWRSGWMDMG
jgi:inhibitor of KinA sporulation pathway (predicted exonuclease)